MYRLHGFFTQNSLKTLYVLEELGVEWEFNFVDLAKGANRNDEFRAMTLNWLKRERSVMMSSTMPSAK